MLTWDAPQRWTFLNVAMLFVCCGRTSLLSDYQSEAEPGGAAGTTGGNTGTNASGGSAPSGVAGSGGVAGGSNDGGDSSTAGRFGQAGTANGGLSSGGRPANDDCKLAVADCRLPTQPECDSRALCEGALLGHRQFGTRDAAIVDIATSSSGSVAITGFFSGKLDFSGKSLPLSSQDGDDTSYKDAFVALFDENGEAEWAYAYGGPGWQWATGVRFAPNGDLVVQGEWQEGTPGNPSLTAPGAFVIRLSAAGELIWSKLAGNYTTIPGRLGIDPDGYIVLAGYYQGSLNFLGASLGPRTTAGYLVRLTANGDLLWARDVVPKSWPYATVTNVAVDDQGQITVIGHGARANGDLAAFFRKLGADGEPFFTHELLSTRGVTAEALAIDREQRILIGGSFGGQFTNQGQTLQSSSRLGADAWAALYAGDGKLAWSQAYPSDGNGASVRDAVADPFGNFILAGTAARLRVGDWTLQPSPEKSTDALFVFKLRPDSTPAWLRSFEGRTAYGVVATSNQGAIWLAGEFLNRLWFGADFAEAPQGYAHAYLTQLSP